jgi:hypothetical protein
MSDTTTQTDTTVADASSVDATKKDEGQSAAFVTKDNAAPKPDEKIPQDKWQKMVEKTKKADERDAKLKQALGVKPDEDVDVVELLVKRTADLETAAIQSKFEASVPKVLTPKYAEAWTKILADKKHLIQKGDLTHEDCWKMIRDEGEYKSQSEAVQATQKEEKEAFSGSIPFFGSSVASMSDKSSDMDKEIARKMNWTEKTFKAAGVPM